MKRKGKITPKAFLFSVLFQCFDGSQRSLNDHLLDLQLNEGVKVEKQSLNERFNAKAVAFLKQLLQEHLKQKWSSSLPWKGMSTFNEVLIEDSVRFQLPDHLKEEYPGNGGGASEAGAHLQYEFDLKTGCVKTMSVHHAKYQDQTAARDQMAKITKGSLIIRDLGYFVVDVLSDIDEKEAYFISRLRPKTSIYLKENEQYVRLTTPELYDKVINEPNAALELLCYVGSKKVPVRLIAEHLPEQVVEERLRRANKEATRKGRKLSNEYRTFLRLNLFITNVSEKELTAQQVHEFYRLRWQVELVFKTWKSHFHFHKFKKMKVHRMECYLYASLLFIFSGWELYYRMSVLLWEERRILISKIKFAKAWVQARPKWRQLLERKGKEMEVFIGDFREYCLNYLIQEKRKGRLNLEEYLISNVCNSDS